MSQGERTIPLGAIHFVAFTEPCQTCFLNLMKINYKQTCLICHLSPIPEVSLEERLLCAIKISVVLSTSED